MEVSKGVMEAMLKYPRGFAFRDRVFPCKDILSCAKRALSYRYYHFQDMLFFYHSGYFFPLERPSYLYCYAIVCGNLIVFHREIPFEINSEQSYYDKTLRRWVVCLKIKKR